MPDQSAATDGLMRIYDLVCDRKLEQMHFHEVAIRDPFEAEREYQTLCDDVRRIVVEAGVTSGYKWTEWTGRVNA